MKPMPPTVTELATALSTLERYAAAGGTRPDPPGAQQQPSAPQPPTTGSERATLPR